MTAEADHLRSDRQAFALPGGKHDALVRKLGRILPAGIGVLAALLIFSPLAPRGEVSFLLDRNKVAIAENRLSVENAMYRGQDSNGRPFSLTAGKAVQRSSRDTIVKMENLEARLLLEQGPALLSASAGQYDFGDEKVLIDGLVRFTAADGYRMVARDVTINLHDRSLVGEGKVDGAIPAGTFSADHFTADLDERTITLDGEARLRLEPGKLRIP